MAQRQFLAAGGYDGNDKAETRVDGTPLAAVALPTILSASRFPLRHRNSDFFRTDTRDL
jgi:hypothetical protein